jgi:hypothetical protein
MAEHKYRRCDRYKVQYVSKLMQNNTYSECHSCFAKAKCINEAQYQVRNITCEYPSLNAYCMQFVLL